MKITKEMKIEEILQKHPETMEVFMQRGFHCIGCAAANFESLEQGALAHGIDVEKFVEELNKFLHNKTNKSDRSKL